MRKLLVVLGSVALVAGLAVPVAAVGRSSSNDRFTAMVAGRGKDKGDKTGGRRATGRGGRGERGAGGGTGGPRHHRLEKGHYGQYFECGWIGCASEWIDPYHGSSPGGVRHYGDRFHYYDPQYYAVTYPESQIAGGVELCDPLAVPPPGQAVESLSPQQPPCKYDPRCDCFYNVWEQPPSAQVETPTAPDATAPAPAPIPDQPAAGPIQPAWSATSSE